MKNILLILALLLIAQAIQAQGFTQKMHYRIDTLTATAKGGVTDWKPCYFPSLGGDYHFSAIAPTQTADIRIVFRYGDTLATVLRGLYGGGFIPKVSGVFPTVYVQQVLGLTDTLWLKGSANDIVYGWQF